MKSRDSLVRFKRFHVQERRRRVSQIEMMIAEFDRMAADLDREIALEEQKSGICDPAHFAYSTYARAARQRRDNLRRSAQDLHAQLDDAKADLTMALDELAKAEDLEDRERALDAREPVSLSAVGAMGASA